jgi:PAS domain S-box-containing protein
MSLSSPRRHGVGPGEQSESLQTTALGSQRGWNGRAQLLIVRLAISAAVIGALLASMSQLAVIDHAVGMLVLLVAVVGFATVWGWQEALTAAIAGGIGLVYFLAPRGLIYIAGTEQRIAWAAFLVAALGIGQLAARAKRLLKEAHGMVDLSLDPLCIRDPHGNLTRVNPSMVALLGWSEQELRSRPWLYYVHPDDHERTAAAIESLSHGNFTVDFENRYRTKDGRWLWLQWRAAAPAPGEPSVSAAARDITEIKEMEIKLHELATQLMTAREEERRSIARDLHDHFTQRLSTLGIELGLLKRVHSGPAVVELTGELSRLQAQIFDLTESIRKLSHSLHPSILEHSDLAASLNALCSEFTAQHGIAATFEGRDVPEEIPRPVTVALYRIAQESLHNVAQHSSATEVSIILAGDAGPGLCLDIIDNGKGFDPRHIKSRPGLGLVSIEERARQIGGTFTIDSVQGSGTRLNVHVPLTTMKRARANEA